MSDQPTLSTVLNSSSPVTPRRRVSFMEPESTSDLPKSTPSTPKIMPTTSKSVMTPKTPGRPKRASVTPKTTPTTPKLTPSSLKSRKRPRKVEDVSQTILDAGQSKVGLENCKTCGMTYNVDHESDVKTHEEFHNRFTAIKPFQLRVTQVAQWDKEVKHVKLTSPVTGALFVIPEDSKVSTIKKKVEEIFQDTVNDELGFCDDVSIWKPKRLALMLVVESDRVTKAHQLIAGVALVDPVREVFLQPHNKTVRPGNYVGINRLWIHPTMRRKGLATFLVNASRRLIYPNVPFLETKAAFYAPAGAGLEFVIAYFGRQNDMYLTYADE